MIAARATQSRVFNELTIDPLIGTITKRSRPQSGRMTSSGTGAGSIEGSNAPARNVAGRDTLDPSASDARVPT